jgi:hypothetical protein
MTDPAMSPAQKVFAAWRNASDGHYEDGEWIQHSEAQLAAALRAAADEVVPAETWLGTEEPCYAYYRQRCNTRRELLAIAAELEAMP